MISREIERRGHTTYCAWLPRPLALEPLPLELLSRSLELELDPLSPLLSLSLVPLLLLLVSMTMLVVSIAIRCFFVGFGIITTTTIMTIIR